MSAVIELWVDGGVINSCKTGLINFIVIYCTQIIQIRPAINDDPALRLITEPKSNAAGPVPTNTLKMVRMTVLHLTNHFNVLKFEPLFVLETLCIFISACSTTISL